MWYFELKTAFRLARFWPAKFLLAYSKQQARHRMGRIYRLALQLWEERDD